MGMPNIPPPSSAISEPGIPQITYRQTRSLPRQLLDQATVCIEEQLFTQGISLLSRAVTSGNGTTRPAYVPPVPHLSLAVTLMVHPSMTTRTTSKDRHAAADEALRYLRNLHQITGTEGSGLYKAVQFQDAGLSRNRGKTRHSEVPSDEDETMPGFIRSPYARRDSLFTNADDFWAVVGWAFNCSVAHKHRWARWKLWLELMLDILESDLDAKRHQSKADPPSDIDSESNEPLISQYFANYQQGRNTKRTILRAILADGQPASLSQFPEIWRNETRLPKPKHSEPTLPDKKKRKLDLDHGNFGDYFDSDSSSHNSPTTTTSTTHSLRTSRNSTRAPSTKPRTTLSPSTRASPTVSSDSPSHGSTTSLTLRHRFLALLTRLCHAYPSAFLDIEDLFDLFTEFLRPLPLPTFTALVFPTSSSTRHLDPDAQSSLLQMLLRPLLSANAPVYNANALTQKDFEVFFAPFAAATGSAGDNAKVGCLLEGLLRLLWVEGRLDVRSKEGLGKAVEDGVQARREKVGWDGRKKTGSRAKDDEEAVRVLEASAERMDVLLDMM